MDKLQKGLELERQGQYNKALDMHIESCSLAKKEAYFNIGQLYYEGLGVKRNESKAIEYWKQACDGEIGQACYNIGINFVNMYDQLPVSSMLDIAIEYYQKGCKYGFRQSYIKLDQIKWKIDI